MLLLEPLEEVFDPILIAIQEKFNTVTGISYITILYGILSIKPINPYSIGKAEA